MKSQNSRIAFIMAGGIGERFWPITSEVFPKYAMTMNAKKSFLKSTFDRLTPVFSQKNIGVITSSKHRKLVLALLPALNPKLLLCEPERKNTAAAVTWGTITAKRMYGEDAVVSFYPADALIRDSDKFDKAVIQACACATSCITLLGIPPTRPATGYGYIQISKTKGSSASVKHFKEKPNKLTAQKYLKSKDFLWNAGIFFWTPKHFFNEMKVYNKSYLNQFKSLMNGKIPGAKSVANVFQKLPSEPIDRLLIEKVSSLFCVKAQFKWDDIGSWDALHRMNAAKKSDNLILANTLSSDVSGSIVYSRDLKFLVHGVKDLIIAEKDGVIMICPRKDAERVKELRQKWIEKQR